MRFRLSTLLLVLAVVGIATAGFIGRRNPGRYGGYFAPKGIQHLIQGVDPAIRSTEQLGHTGNSEHRLTLQWTHQLAGDRPITADFVRRLMQRVLADLDARGIGADAELDPRSTDSSSGFQVSFEEGRYRGVLTIRLTAKEPESKTHRAELFENIVVFPNR